MKYGKIIDISDTGLIWARVYNLNSGERVGIERFNIWFNREAAFKRAHKWADKMIQDCNKYCTDVKEAK